MDKLQTKQLTPITGPYEAPRIVWEERLELGAIATSHCEPGSTGCDGTEPAPPRPKWYKDARSL